MYRSGSSNYNSRSGYGRSSYGSSSSYGKSSLLRPSTNKPFLFSIIGLALIVILGYVMFSLYTTYSVDKYDNRLGCLDTIKNMLGMYIPEEPPKPKPKPKPAPNQNPHLNLNQKKRFLILIKIFLRIKKLLQFVKHMMPNLQHKNKSTKHIKIKPIGVILDGAKAKIRIQHLHFL